MSATARATPTTSPPRCAPRAAFRTPRWSATRRRAVKWMRAQPGLNGKVGLFGSCSGGRHAYHLCLQQEGCRRLRRPVGWPRRDGQGGAQRQDADVADRAHQEPLLPAARHLRQRGSRAEPRAGEPARGRAQEARQGLRVLPLRRRRPRHLLLPPAACIGWSRRSTAGTRCSPSSASIWRSRRRTMCTSIVEIAAAEGMAKREDEWFPLTHAVVAYDHARHAAARGRHHPRLRQQRPAAGCAGRRSS